jgi:protocatechuate 3,4-dioxygenase beta subunit
MARRLPWVLGSIVLASVALSQTATPPGDETPEVAAAIDAVTRALEKGTTASAILSDPAHMALHPWTRFRHAIRDHAETGAVTIVTPGEPGERLTVRGSVVDSAGAPVAGALVYLYQTNSEGWYAADGVHVSGNSGDERHARLFGYVIADAKGRFTLRTIRPAGYPGGELPQHIHVEIRRRGGGGALVTEIVFSDDPRLAGPVLEASRRHGFVICDVRRAAGGAEVEARLEVR